MLRGIFLWLAIFVSATLAYQVTKPRASTTSTAKAAASSPSSRPSDTEIKQRITAYVNRVLGFQGLDRIDVAYLGAPDAEGLRHATVRVAKGTQAQSLEFTITADGKEIVDDIQGPMAVFKLNSDPYAENRAKLNLQGAPSEGEANAPVTIVEFSDLQCPYCKQENEVIKNLLALQPGRFRVVFKYYPLVNIHPWAMDAAKSAVCVAEQNPEHFWMFAQAVFDQQDSLESKSPAEVVPRLRDFALESATQPAAYDACLKNPSTEAKVRASIGDGDSVGVTTTPTLFINGRMVVGAIQAEVMQALVAYEGKYPTQASAYGLAAGVKGQACGGCAPLPPPPVIH